MGERAKLVHPGVSPYCALMQVAAEDTHANYVVCRGYDPRVGRFFDYVAGDPDKIGISVAKPYGRRTVGLYQIGQVIPAVLPLTGLYSDLEETWAQQGQNPGVSTLGHPKLITTSPLLTDDINILYDDNSRVINWMFLHGEVMARFEMLAALSTGLNQSAEANLQWWDHENSEWTEAPTVTVYNTQHGAFSKPATTEGDGGADGWATFCPDRDRWEIVWMDTPGFFWATLHGTLSHSDASTTVHVSDVLSGYDLWGVNHGDEQLVFNPIANSGGGGDIDYWFAGYTGDYCLCRWDIYDEKFWIVAIEPNDQEWQTLDVVVSVNFGAQTVETKEIKLPPWTPVPA